MKKNYILILIASVFIFEAQSQVLIDANGTRVGATYTVPNLTTPYVSTPNQTATNYYPIWIEGPTKVRTPPSNSDIVFENFTNNYDTNGTTGSTTHQEPMIRGGWGNTAWLGSPHHPWWQVWTNELWVKGNQVTSSDSRYKTNIKNHPSVIDQIMLLRPVVYDNIEINENTTEEKKSLIESRNKNHHGLIAQELIKIYPELVIQDNNGYYGVKYHDLITILLKALQEQQYQIDSIKTELNRN